MGISATDLLMAGVDADQFLVGPAVILLQDAANYTAESGDAADGYPRDLDDIISLTDATAMTANGWYYFGYTENVAMARNRTVVQHDSDQEARVKTVHDVWENSITVSALETTLAKTRDFLGGKTTDPIATTGAGAASEQVSFGNPLTIVNRRTAILWIDDSGYLWAVVHRKVDIRPTGGPTFTRTGRVEWPLEFSCKPDTRVADVNDRVMRIYKTDAAVT